MIKVLILLILISTNALSSEEISICACENPENVIVVQNINKYQYNKLQEYENDLICTLFESNRVDNRDRIDIAVCTKDANT